MHEIDGVNVPMTQMFAIDLAIGYEWDEGRLFQHDATGLYTWIQESGCSCNYFLSDVGRHNAYEYVRDLSWMPLDSWYTTVKRYIESEDTAWHNNGPVWRAEQTARFQMFLHETKKDA